MKKLMIVIAVLMSAQVLANDDCDGNCRKLDDPQLLSPLKGVCQQLFSEKELDAERDLAAEFNRRIDKDRMNKQKIKIASLYRYALAGDTIVSGSLQEKDDSDNIYFETTSGSICSYRENNWISLIDCRNKHGRPTAYVKLTNRNKKIERKIYELISGKLVEESEIQLN